MSITFERATPADAETLVSVQIAAFHDDNRLYGVPLDGPPGYDSLEVMLAKIGEDECYKILADGQTVGVITLFPRAEGHYHLDVLAIHPQYHNRGIGTMAIHFIEHTYPATLWTLDTPLYAVRNQHFYEKFGYVKVGESTEPDGLILIAYEKRV